MTESFDLKDLSARLEAKGLPAVEGVAKLAVTEILDWASESCAIHDNPLVKAIGVMAVETVRPLILEQVDKIDGVQS